MEKSRRSFLKTGLTGGTAGILLPLLDITGGRSTVSELKRNGKSDTESAVYQKISEIINRYGGEFGE